MWLLNPKQLEWNKVSMPNFQIRKSKSMCKRTEHGSDGIQSPQCHQTHMRYSWDIEQVAECHKGWRTTPCQLGACRQSLACLGWNRSFDTQSGRQEGGRWGRYQIALAPLYLPKFLICHCVSPCVPKGC